MTAFPATETAILCQNKQKVQGGIGRIQGRGRTKVSDAPICNSKDGHLEGPTGKKVKRGRTATAAFPDQVPYSRGIGYGDI